MKPDHILKPHIKINSKWIKDINIRPQIIKVLEEHTGSKILDTVCTNIFLDISPQARETRGKVNKWGYLKLKGFVQQKK